MGEFDSKIIIRQLRSLALEGRTPSQMFNILRESVGAETHVLTLMHYFQEAFCLDLLEAKPFVGLTRGGTGEIKDEPFLDELVKPAIAKHQEEWNVCPSKQ